MPAPSYDGPAAAASVIMSPALRRCPILFVEGICEVSLLSNHFPEYDAQIIPCGGHSGVREAIKAIELWESQNDNNLMILGFIDRDYGQKNRLRRITTTNYRDLEIDMYKSKAGYRLLKEKASKNKCSDVRASIDEAISELRAIGLVRLYNSRENNPWNINGINLERCIEKGSINFDKFLLLLKQINGLNNDALDGLKYFFCECDSVLTEAIIRGHDLSLLIGKWLRSKIGNRTKGETEWNVMEENLRLATDFSELLRYHWARRIRDHLTINPQKLA